MWSWMISAVNLMTCINVRYDRESEEGLRIYPFTIV